ncbi:MAG: hypothetical protein AUJ75_02175 [Candidatus Omnitrophica bacterium CG1_02_49_10]|nr:MAG: hypothetical protein AUJ75_02175 [Candidatus Omnitrophica bacterium CG1_02_49_10]
MNSMRLSDIYAPISADLKVFEGRLKRELTSPDRFINSIFGHILKGKGKRLRPVLVFLSARACGSVTQEVRDMAVAIELIHTATLIHDDVVDMAEMRRGRPAVNKKWKNDIAVLMGDYLYSKATNILAGMKDKEVPKMVSRTAGMMCEGELAHMKRRFDPGMTESEYMDVISRKTSSLLRLASSSGARLSGATPSRVKMLSDYGYNFGTAFQIVDDILDITGDENMLGKTLGLDIKRGGPTLPLILLKRSSSRRKNRDLFSGAGRLKRDIDKNDIIKRSMDMALGFADAAKDAIKNIDEDRHKASLDGLVDYVIGRVRC